MAGADISGIQQRQPQEDSLQVSSLLPDRSIFHNVSALDLSVGIGSSNGRAASDRYTGGMPAPVRLTPEMLARPATKKIVPEVLEVYEDKAGGGDGSESSFKEKSRGSSLDR